MPLDFDRQAALDTIEAEQIPVRGTVVATALNVALVELHMRCLADAPVEVVFATRVRLWGEVDIYRRRGAWSQ